MAIAQMKLVSAHGIPHPSLLSVCPPDLPCERYSCLDLCVSSRRFWRFGFLIRRMEELLTFQLYGSTILHLNSRRPLKPVLALLAYGPRNLSLVLSLEVWLLRRFASQHVVPPCTPHHQSVL